MITNTQIKLDMFNALAEIAKVNIWIYIIETKEIKRYKDDDYITTGLSYAKIISFLHQDSHDSFIDDFESVLNGKEKSTTNDYRFFINNEYKVWQITISSHIDKNTRLIDYLIFTQKDIYIDKKKENKCIDKCSSIINNSPTSIINFDDNGYIIKMNKRASCYCKKLLNFNIHKESIFSFQSFSDKQKENFRNHISFKAIVEYAINETISDDYPNILFGETFYKPVLDDDGNFLINTLYINDITEELSNLSNYERILKYVHIINENCGISFWYYKPGSRIFKNRDIFAINTLKSLTVDQMLFYTHKDDREKMLGFLEKANNRKLETTNSDIRFISFKDNTYHTFHNIITPFYNERNEIELYGFTRIDQHERIILNNKKNLSEGLLSSIIKSLPTMVFVKDIDHDFRFVVANDSFMNFFVKKDINIIGKSETEFSTKEKAEVCRTSDLKSINSTIDNPNVNIEEFIDEHGEITYLKSIKFAHKINERNLLICSAIDVTKLLNAKKKAEESDQLKSAFLSNMSHEIRTPLNAIVGFSNLLTQNDEPLSDEDKNLYSKIINTNSENLLNLINDILDLSRIETERITIKFKELNFSDLFNSLYIGLEPRKPKGIEFICKSPTDNLIINSDANRLSQIINNLVTNAFKFTSVGNVTMSYEYSENSLTITVSDTGIGIEKDKLPTIFNRFVKLNEFKQGTGLGLAINKAIVKALNGEISVTSDYGKGSSFQIKLPIR